MKLAVCAVCGGQYTQKKNGLPHGHGGSEECRSPTKDGQSKARGQRRWVIRGADGWVLPGRSGTTPFLLSAGLFSMNSAGDLFQGEYLVLMEDAWWRERDRIADPGSVGYAIGLRASLDVDRLARDRALLRKIRSLLCEG